MILVTGATGTVGAELVRRLARQGLRVRTLVRDHVEAETIEMPGAEIMPGDLADRESLELPLLDVDGLFLASSPTLEQAQLEGNAIGAARDAGVQHVVKLSAIGAGPESPVQVLRQHASVEEALRRSGLRWTILQPNFFMQDVLKSAHTVGQQVAIEAPAGGGKASLVDVRDVAAVAAEALVNRNLTERTLVLTGPEPVSYADVAEKLSAVTGRPVNYVALPPEIAREQMLDFGMPEWMVDDLVIQLSVIYAQGYASPVTSTIEEVIGEPPRTFETFAQECAETVVGANSAP